MKIYKIKNELDCEVYIIATSINNAIKFFEKYAEKDGLDLNIKEIKCIGFCVVGK